MLHIDQNRSKKWLVMLLVAAAAGAAFWGWRATQPAAGGDGSSGGVFPWSRAEQSVDKAPASGLGNKWAELTAKQTAPNQRPAFLTEEEWTSLQEALRDTPNREQEQARIVEYLRFQKQVQLWQSMHDSQDTTQRQKLATELLNSIPDRLAKRELNAGEAQLLQAAFLEDLVPDAQQRQARMEAEKQRLMLQPTEAEVAAQRQEEAKQQDYKRRETEIIAQWQAMPADQRDQRWLESQLDAARRAAYEGR
jgi:hypothetical protein